MLHTTPKQPEIHDPTDSYDPARDIHDLVYIGYAKKESHNAVVRFVEIPYHEYAVKIYVGSNANETARYKHDSVFIADPFGRDITHKVLHIEKGSPCRPYGANIGLIFRMLDAYLEDGENEFDNAEAIIEAETVTEPKVV